MLGQVTSECCGFCILNNAHLMKMWNCTGLSSLVGNTLGINALARYCKVTKGCKEERPCLGDPVKMGDPQVLLDPTTYSVQCDQLNSGLFNSLHVLYLSSLNKMN